MGRIKTQLVKRITKKLMVQSSEDFTEDFGHNKSLVSKYVKVSSLKIRNIIAGYVTRLKRKGYNPNEFGGGLQNRPPQAKKSYD